MNHPIALSQPGTCRRLMLRAKELGDILLALEADAHAVLEGIRTQGPAPLLPREDYVANELAHKQLMERYRRAS